MPFSIEPPFRRRPGTIHLVGTKIVSSYEALALVSLGATLSAAQALAVRFGGG